jgi:hypothetical protein
MSKKKSSGKKVDPKRVKVADLDAAEGQDPKGGWFDDSPRGTNSLQRPGGQFNPPTGPSAVQGIDRTKIGGR